MRLISPSLMVPRRLKRLILSFSHGSREAKEAKTRLFYGLREAKEAKTRLNLGI